METVNELKLVVEYEPQVFTFDVSDEDYAEFLDSNDTPEFWFGYLIEDVEPQFSVKLVSTSG